MGASAHRFILESRVGDVVRFAEASRCKGDGRMEDQATFGQGRLASGVSGSDRRFCHWLAFRACGGIHNPETVIEDCSIKCPRSQV